MGPVVSCMASPGKLLPTRTAPTTTPARAEGIFGRGPVLLQWAWQAPEARLEGVQVAGAPPLRGRSGNAQDTKQWH
eukprot:14637468-Alexandrium_andersonii.AAC.1